MRITRGMDHATSSSVLKLRVYKTRGNRAHKALPGRIARTKQGSRCFIAIELSGRDLQSLSTRLRVLLRNVPNPN